MERKRRKLLLSCITILLCITLLVAGTYALFSDSVVLKNHISAGDLDITLYRTKLVSNTLDEDGFISPFTDSQRINFSNGSPQGTNIFGLDEEVKMVPCTSYVATMEITNNSDVAFGYYIEFVLTQENQTLDNQDLLEQISISIKAGNKTISQTLSASDKKLGSDTAPVGVVTIGSTAEFEVTLMFEDSEDNNDAMGQEVYFDIIVHAIQVTSNPNA